MNILLVDPDSRRRAHLHAMLLPAGHTVSESGDAVGALASLLETRPDVVLIKAALGGAGGVELFRQMRIAGPALQPYLISVRDPELVTSTDPEDPGWNRDADDILPDPVRREELMARLQVARRMLDRRRDEAAQLKRISRIPADSPHPIVELTPSGALVHANLASLPLLDAWGWAAGRPAPPALRHLAAAARKSGKPKRTDLRCGDRAYSFMAIGLDDGDVCLYGHDMGVPSATRAGDRGAALGQPVEPSLNDPLTGLPTQTLLGERMGQALHHARLTGTAVALVKVNLDNCADINDAHGHHIGDQLLMLVGEALRDTVRTGDTVLRDAGDGFILVLQGIGNRETAGATCSRFIRAAQQAGDDAGLGVRFTLSLGLALFPEDADSEQTLVERADQALTEAKNSGRNCWRDYQAAVGANPMIGAERLLPRLMSALHTRQLHAQYQPIIASASGTVAGFEALVRWHDPELGWIPPDRFIPIAESRGLISEVGRQMADMVFRQLAVWRDVGFPVTVSLNISKRQLWEPRFVDEMTELASQHHLCPAWIILEATERQSLVHDPVCRNTLEGLAAAGFRLSIDDFGTGHSTFDMVTDLPFHELKINMTLSRKVQTPRGRHVVRAILEMCEQLGLESVSEGIEDAALGEALRKVGSTKLQGYHFSPPLGADASLEFLKRSRSTAGF